MITVCFEKRGKSGLCEFLYDSIKSQILDGTLKANEKLPSKRNLSSNLGVSVITVQNAYSQLASEGCWALWQDHYSALRDPAGIRGAGLSGVRNLRSVWTLCRPDAGLRQSFCTFPARKAIAACVFPPGRWGARTG